LPKLFLGASTALPPEFEGAVVRLPDDSIGVTDILSWRECGRRMSFGMRRHTAEGEHPEAASAMTAYGSAFHDAVSHHGETDCTIDEAVQVAFDLHARWLEPDDLPRLKADLETYMQREPLNVVPVSVEGEIRVPLLQHEGRTIYFRGRLDRLYESTVRPGWFIHRDYKTSRHPKSEEEVHNDIQMWAYNWAIHEVYPEVETLVQEYDQLRFGVHKTMKSDEQRAQIREWLQRQVRALLADEEYGPDGLLLPTRNKWCAYCQIMESCSVVRDSTEFGLVEIAALAPEEKVGRKTQVALEYDRLQEYVDRLEQVGQAKGILERYESAVKALLKGMPQARRAELGYELRERSATKFPAEAMAAMHRMLGDEQFYELVGVSQQAIEKKVADEQAKTRILGMGEKFPATTFVQRSRKKS